MQVRLAPQRVVWGWSLAFQKLTTQRPLHKESRQSGSQHKSTLPPGERKQQRTTSRHLLEIMGVGEKQVANGCPTKSIYYLTFYLDIRTHFSWISEILAQKVLQFFFPLTTSHLFSTTEFACIQNPKVEPHKHLSDCASIGQEITLKRHQCPFNFQTLQPTFT